MRLGAPVRICAGGARQLVSLPRPLDRNYHGFLKSLRSILSWCQMGCGRDGKPHEGDLKPGYVRQSPQFSYPASDPNRGCWNTTRNKPLLPSRREDFGGE